MSYIKGKRKTYEKKHVVKRHLKLKVKLFIYIVLFLSSFILTLFLATKSFDYENVKSITYNENQFVDYKVYLKPNDFYEENYLTKNMIYVASLIDKININFSYLFKIEENTNIRFDYSIIGQLVIANPDGTTNYFSKEYTLLDTKHKEMNNSDNLSINENIEIDYDYYNDLANEFRSSYAVQTNSYLNVYMRINKSDADYSGIKKVNNLSLTIPLSEKAIEIMFDTQENNSKNTIVPESKLLFNKNIFILEFIMFIITSVLLIKVIKLVLLLPKKYSNYDKFINKLLKNYDRLIVETTTPIDFDNSNLITINKFEELLDVRDNLKLPVMYFNAIDHEKSYFYIRHGDEVYLLVIEADDLDKNGN